MHRPWLVVACFTLALVAVMGTGWRVYADRKSGGSQAFLRSIASMSAWTGEQVSDQDPRFKDIIRQAQGHLAEGLTSWQQLPATDFYRRRALQGVLRNSIRDRDRAQVLATIPQAPFLLSAALDHGWIEDVGPALDDVMTATMAMPAADLDDLLEAWSSVARPSDKALLKRGLGACRDGRVQARCLRRLDSRPGFDTTTLCRELWAFQATAFYVDQQLGLVPRAVQAGVVEAVGRIPDMLASPYVVLKDREEMLEWWRRQPAFQGQPIDAAWLAANQPGLRWQNGAWQRLPPNQKASEASPASTDHQAPRVPQPQDDQPRARLPPGMPPDADAETVRQWLARQAAAVKDLPQVSMKHPLIQQVAGLPSEHIAVVMESFRVYHGNGKFRAILTCALPSYVREEHRAFVTEHLVDYPALISVIGPRGWTKDVVSSLRILGETNPSGMTPPTEVELMRLLCEHGEPADVGLLSTMFRRLRHYVWQGHMAAVLVRRADIPLDDLVREAWERPSVGIQGPREALAVWAARAGISEALPSLFALASGEGPAGDSASLRLEAQAYVSSTFGIAPDAKAISRWWQQAKDSLVWDQVRHRWNTTAPNPSSL